MSKTHHVIKNLQGARNTSHHYLTACARHVMLLTYSAPKTHHVTNLHCIQDISRQQPMVCPRHIMSVTYSVFMTHHVMSLTVCPRLRTLTPRAIQAKPRAVLTIDRREGMMRMGTPCMAHMVGMWLTSILGSASCASNTKPTDADSRPRVTEFTPRNIHRLKQKGLIPK